MKPLTPEERAQLDALKAKEQAFVNELDIVARQISEMIVSGEDYYINREALFANAKQIRELLAPYDEAPVMLGEFVPASTKAEPEVVPFPYDRSPPQSVCPARGDGVYHQWGNVKAPWEEPPKWPTPPAAPFTDTERYRK